MLFVALLAIILPLVLVVGFRQPAKIGMTISAVIVALLAFFIWQMTPIAMAASVVQAIHRSLTILLILFGAVTLLKTMQQTGAMTRIKLGFHTISSDMRVQTVLIAFVFVSLIEGSSGFGTPAVVAAPLLMVLGFRPLAAVALALLGDTVSVTFGAVGTPLIVGLENVSQYSHDLAWVVGAQVTAFDLIIGSLIPIALVSVLVINFGHQTKKAKLHSIVEMIPWSLLIGATYAVSAFFTLRLIGPEFTAIIAASITLIVAAFTALKGIGTPTSVWRSAADESESEDTTPAKIKHIPIWKAWLPYVIAIGLLLITRIIPIVKDFTVKNLDASWLNILGVEGISSTWAVLYSPGTILLLAAIAAALIGQRSLKPLATASRQSLKIVSGAMLALIPTLILVQIFSNSGFNTANLESMPVYIGRTLADLLGGLWVLCAPLLGTIGAFIAGSATVSNLTMGPVQESIAASTNLPLIIILSLQTIGGAAGNVIAIHNVVAASVVVGLDHREELIMRKLILPAIVYIIIAAILGTAAVYLL